LKGSCTIVVIAHNTHFDKVADFEIHVSKATAKLAT